jgi:hypothetical protein
MTYTMIGLGVGAAQQCQGGEVSEDGLGGRGDHCCPVDTWSSVTYRVVKGSTAWRRWREKLIREGIKKALEQSDMGLATNIHQVAYNHGLNEVTAVSPALVSRVKKALDTFRVLFPASRWYKKPNCRKGEYDDGVCTGGEKTLSCWRSRPVPHTPQVASLLSQVTGVSLTTHHLDVVSEWEYVPPAPPRTGSWDPYKEERDKWTRVPSAFAHWVSKVHQLIGTSPGSGRHDLGSYRRPIGPGELFSVSGSRVVPSPWMEQFLQAMEVPKPKLKTVPAGRRVTFTRPRMTVGRHVTAPPTEEGGEPAPPPVQPPAEPEGIDSRILAIGGVALVGAAFGAYVLLK